MNNNLRKIKNKISFKKQEENNNKSNDFYDYYCYSHHFYNYIHYKSNLISLGEYNYNYNYEFNYDGYSFYDFNNLEHPEIDITFNISFNGEHYENQYFIPPYFLCEKTDNSFDELFPNVEETDKSFDELFPNVEETDNSFDELFPNVE